ncbi:MAG: hypothetical protein ACYS17_17105 [Planctomycetota bacterium]
MKLKRQSMTIMKKENIRAVAKRLHFVNLRILSPICTIVMQIWQKSWRLDWSM